MHGPQARVSTVCPMARSVARWAWFVATVACAPTVDSLGHGVENDADAPGGDASGGGDGGAAALGTLSPRTGPSSYPNVLSEVMGLSESMVSAEIDKVYDQLFHGDAATEAIYFRAGSDQAYIQDILHGDVRTEGIGFGMMIAVQLDNPSEFDALWRYAESTLRIKAGPNSGYYGSFCDTSQLPIECTDAFGHQLMLTALMFAHGRWGSEGDIDYEASALRLLEVMRHKEEENGGVVDGVTNMFDPSEQLPLDEPHISSAGVTRPAVVMPAFYELWFQATGDSFWKEAAASGRAYLARTAHPTTGLLPIRSRFDGTPLPGWDFFAAEGYRAQLNIVLDQLWFSGAPWNVEEANRLLGFFLSQGPRYGASYSLAGGSPLDPGHVESLVFINGATAAIATLPERNAFIGEAWSMATPTDEARYYGGLLKLVALMVLGGEFRVY